MYTCIAVYPTHCLVHLICTNIITCKNLAVLWSSSSSKVIFAVSTHHCSFLVDIHDWGRLLYIVLKVYIYWYRCTSIHPNTDEINSQGLQPPCWLCIVKFDSLYLNLIMIITLHIYTNVILQLNWCMTKKLCRK